MQASGTVSPMQSALELWNSGERLLARASAEAASGRLDNLAQTLIDLTSARHSIAAGAKLAQVANETTGCVLDILV